MLAAKMCPRRLRTPQDAPQTEDKNAMNGLYTQEMLQKVGAALQVS